MRDLGMAADPCTRVLVANASAIGCAARTVRRPLAAGAISWAMSHSRRNRLRVNSTFSRLKTARKRPGTNRIPTGDTQHYGHQPLPGYGLP